MFTLPLADNAHLGPLEPWRAAEFLAAVERAREHLSPWIPFAHRVRDEASAREHLQRFADLQARDAGAFYGIWVDGVLSGGTLYRGFDPVMRVAEVGVWLTPDAVGRGLIQAAVGHMIDYLFRVRDAARIEWYCNPANERSRAAAARLGLTREGLMRSNFVVDGQRQDSEIWAILPTEWRDMQGHPTNAS